MERADFHTQLPGDFGWSHLLIMKCFEWGNSFLMKPLEVLAENCHIRTCFYSHSGSCRGGSYVKAFKYPAFARKNKYMPQSFSWSQHLEFLWYELCAVN